jgi:hypothetical protein
MHVRGQKPSATRLYSHSAHYICDTYLLDTFSSSSCIKATEEKHILSQANGTSCLIFEQISF